MENRTLPQIKRRDFIKDSALMAGGLAILPILNSCNDDLQPGPPQGENGFNEGIASFDPGTDSVILWTRYNPSRKDQHDPIVFWEVFDDPGCGHVIQRGSLAALAVNDYTVSIKVKGLSPSNVYYYRFRNKSAKIKSAIGKTKTLPSGAGVSSVALAVVSCSNFQSGLFNVYGAVAESEADVVVHLGDYIYEYGKDEYGSNGDTVALGRVHKPSTEIVTLQDYRKRYKQYRQDSQLQLAHQMKPFICVWDDHELANDAFKDGAENHQASEGDFELRKMAAQKAWYEYLPADISNEREIYRSFQFGNLVNLIMLDTRLAGRDKQLSYSNYFSEDGSFNTGAFLTDWQNPSRTILGHTQRSWLAGQLASSGAEWQVLGSQVLMGKMFVPAELLTLIAQLTSSGATPELLAAYNQAVTELSTIKIRILQGDPALTPAEVARVKTVLPYNLDAWDGYPVEREFVFGFAQGKKLVSIAGDTHNAWYSDLKNSQGKVEGEEFATPSVSSPGFESVFGTSAEIIGGFEQSTTLLIDDLKYLDASRRGYILVEFGPGAVACEWRFVNTIAIEDTSTVVGFSTQGVSVY